MNAITIRVMAIDPGPAESAFVIWDGSQILDKGIVTNHDLVASLTRADKGFSCVPDVCIIEQIKSYGMTVSDSIFDTVYWSGRMAQAWISAKDSFFDRMPRMAVKMHICHDSRARDSNIRQALIDRFGGRDKAIGKKNNPGIFYQVRKDEWSALALGVTWIDQEA